ncbi:MAG: ATP-binding protein [Spirochaetes bacterium]|nr:ATP-binding protein [Spirochaetota bacterium]
MFSIPALILSDFEFKKIDIEVALTKGLPYFEIIGLPGKIVKESCFRIKESILKTMSDFPEKKIIVNLSPSDVPKNTKYLDLPIALNILVQFKLSIMKKELNLSLDLIMSYIKELFSEVLFIGELGLDGQIKADENILSYLINASKFGFKYIFVSDIIKNKLYIYNKNINYIKSEIIFVDTLKTLNIFINKIFNKINKNEKINNTYKFFLQEMGYELKNIFNIESNNYIKIVDREGNDNIKNKTDSNSLTFNDYIENFHIKYGLLISLAGFHNLYLKGATGTGKTLLSKILTNYLPPLTYEEKIELAELYSKFGILRDVNFEITRPVRTPHHSITEIAMLGGGNYLSLGEVTLAHRGVLILDEVNLFKKSVIESLREPVNDNFVSISRVNNKIKLPSSFLLFLISNLCPCGASGDDEKICICSKSEIINFNKKISQAIIDRIDINLIVPKVKKDSNLMINVSPIINNHIKEKIFWDDSNIINLLSETISRQIFRYGNRIDYFNGKVVPKIFNEKVKLKREVELYLKDITLNFGLSLRQHEKLIRISRTVADIENKENIDESHIDVSVFYMILQSISYNKSEKLV